MSEHVGDLLSAYVDGQLEPYEQKQVEVHLQTCAECKHELALITSSQSALAALPMLDAPRGFFVPGYKSFSSARWITTVAAAAAVVAIVMGTIAIPTSVRKPLKAKQLVDMHLASATSLPKTHIQEASWSRHGLPYKQPSHLSGGFVQVDDWHEVSVANTNVVEANYSNGRYELSVFEHDVPPPAIDADDNPQSVRVGTHNAKFVRYPSNALVTWSDGDIAISVVSDNDSDDLLPAAEELASDDDAPQFEQHMLHSSHRMMNALSGN